MPRMLALLLAACALSWASSPPPLEVRVQAQGGGTDSIFRAQSLLEAVALAHGFCQNLVDNASKGNLYDQRTCAEGLRERAKAYFSSHGGEPVTTPTTTTPPPRLAGLSVLVALFGVVPRSIRHVWPAQRERLVHALERHGAKVELFGFDVDVGARLVDGQQVVTSDTDIVPWDVFERLAQDTVDAEIDRTCAVAPACSFSAYATSWLPMQVARRQRQRAHHNPNALRQNKQLDGRNALRQLYAEHRVAHYLARARGRYDVVVALSSDVLPAGELDPIDVLAVLDDPKSVLTSAQADSGGVTNGFYVGSPDAMQRIMSRFERVPDGLLRGAQSYEHVLLREFAHAGLRRLVPSRPDGMHFFKVRNGFSSVASSVSDRLLRATGTESESRVRRAYWAEAVSVLEASLRHNPHSAGSYRMLAWYLAMADPPRREEACAAQRRFFALTNYLGEQSDASIYQAVAFEFVGPHPRARARARAPAGTGAGGIRGSGEMRRLACPSTDPRKRTLALVDEGGEPAGQIQVSLVLRRRRPSSVGIDKLLDTQQGESVRYRYACPRRRDTPFRFYFVVTWGGARSKMFVNWLTRTLASKGEMGKQVHHVYHTHAPHPPPWLAYPNASWAPGLSGFGGVWGQMPRMTAEDVASSLVIYIYRTVEDQLASRLSREHCRNVGGASAAKCSSIAQTESLAGGVVNNSKALTSFLRDGRDVVSFAEHWRAYASHVWQKSTSSAQPRPVYFLHSDDMFDDRRFPSIRAHLGLKTNDDDEHSSLAPPPRFRRDGIGTPTPRHLLVDLAGMYHDLRVLRQSLRSQFWRECVHVE